MSSLFDLYFAYVGDTESPKIFHRWTAISTIGALLGRKVHIPFGHLKIYPNQYIMLMGSPGSRKSTAIKIGKYLAEEAGFENFSADRTSKEALWADMTTMQLKETMDEHGLEQLILDKPVELYIVADEFNDFMGIKNDEFSTALSKMWDCPSEYRTSTKRSENANINKPTINILGGNTPGNLSKGFGPEAINSGFFSRIIFIHGDAISDKNSLIAFPRAPDPTTAKPLIAALRDIRENLEGQISISSGAHQLLEEIYKEFPGMPDYRFSYYQTRRFTHLLKLLTVLTVAKQKLEVEEEDCIQANTILHLAELYMPQALGEFGKARNSEIANDIMQLLKVSNVPMTAQELWRRVSQNLNRTQELLDILKSMHQAGRIQQVKLLGKIGFLPNIDIENKWENGLVDYSYVTEDEHPATIPLNEGEKDEDPMFGL